MNFKRMFPNCLTQGVSQQDEKLQVTTMLSTTMMSWDKFVRHSSSRPYPNLEIRPTCADICWRVLLYKIVPLTCKHLHKHTGWDWKYIRTFKMEIAWWSYQWWSEEHLLCDASAPNSLFIWSNSKSPMVSDQGQMGLLQETCLNGVPKLVHGFQIDLTCDPLSIWDELPQHHTLGIPEDHQWEFLKDLSRLGLRGWGLPVPFPAQLCFSASSSNRETTTHALFLSIPARMGCSGDSPEIGAPPDSLVKAGHNQGWSKWSNKPPK